MRLIDADELLKYKTDHDFIDTHIVWNAPTVKAIPIEYISNWANHLIGYEQYQVSDIVNQLLQDWRKDNEREKKISNIV